MENKLEYIAVDLIDEPVTPMRSAMDAEKIDEMVRSIRRHGLISPLTLRKNGERYEVVAGHRRLTAIKRIGMALVACIVMELSDARSDEMRMAENLYREDVNPVDEARYIRLMVDKHQVEPKQLAEMTGKSEAYLMARYELLDYPQYLIDALANEQLGITAAHWLMKIENERVRAEYVVFAISGGITAKRAQAWYESWKAGVMPRDPSAYTEPIAQEGAVNLAIYDTCAICRNRDDIAKMRMHYAHEDCVTEIARVVRLSEQEPQG